MSQEDINFLRLAGLLIRIAPSAVRQLFDFEFDPVTLSQFLGKNRHKIDELTKKRGITKTQYDLLYPKGKVYSYSKKYCYIDSSIFIHYVPYLLALHRAAFYILTAIQGCIDFD